MNTSIRLRRSTEDISRALNAMERWRQDLRQASAVRVEGAELRIESAAGTNAYRFDGTNIARNTGQSWTTVLHGLAASEMAPCEAGQTSGWRWNFEMNSRGKSGIRPIFTATAVPAGGKAKP